MNVYTDGRRHKEDYFTDRKRRDILVKLLRKEGWTVKVGTNHYPDPTLSTVYFYEAVA